MKSPNELPKKIEIVQLLRGVAAMSVLIAHLWHQRESIVIHPVLNKLAKAGAYGVQIFFVISGFILLYSLYKHDYKIKDYFRFILRRFIRLEPAYIFSILLVLFFAMVMAPWLNVPFESQHHSSFDLVLHLLYLVPFYRGAHWVQGVNWTLAIEFQFYLLVGLLAVLLIHKSMSKYWKHLILIIVSCCSFIYLERTFFLTWLTFFGIGMTTFLLVIKQFGFVDFFIQLLPAALINYVIFSSPYFIVVLTVIPMLIYFLLEKKNLPFQWLGKISYSIYLVHGAVGIFTIKFFETRYSLVSIWSQIGVLLLSTGVSILFSWIFYSLFEVPFTKLSKRMRVGKKTN